MNRAKKASGTLNDETRRLQQVLAITIACHAAVEEGANFDVADVLAVLIVLLGESLRGLDRLEVAHGRP